MARRLAAIMFTDLVGSTQLAQRDEPAALQLLHEQEEVARPVLVAHHGRLVKSTGDGMLVEFANALEAVQCAVEFQRQLHERSGGNGGRPLRVRIGIHVGDVEEHGTDILGDAVNIAARIEPLAEPGGICLSGPAYDQVSNKVAYALERLGPRPLKGVMKAMEVYRVVLPWIGASGRPESALDRSRVAVLPFVNISPDPNDEFFADGLTEELIAGLAPIPGLKVIARTSVMNYKRKEKNVAQIGKELGAGTIVEGSVRKALNRIRVTVQVIDANTEEHLWSSSYDHTLDDIFQVQRDIATKVAGSLPTQLVPSGSAPPTVPALQGTRDMDAYLLFLQGQALVYKSDEAALRQALKFFEQAIEKDPSFGRAYLGASEAYRRLGQAGYIAWSEAIEERRTLLTKVLSITPDSAEAHALRANVAYITDEGLAVVESEARRALELNPNLGLAHDLLGWVAMNRGDLNALVHHMETAYQLDPLSPRTSRSLGGAYLLAGRDEEAMAHWTRTIHLDPISSYNGMAGLYLAKGDLERAESMVQKLEQIAPDSWEAQFGRGYLAAVREDRATALEMIKRLDHAHQPGRIFSSAPGFIYFALGDRDRFFEYMFAAVRDHTLHASLGPLLYSPLFAEARKDPRFQQLLASLPPEMRPGRP